MKLTDIIKEMSNSNEDTLLVDIYYINDDKELPKIIRPLRGNTIPEYDLMDILYSDYLGMKQFHDEMKFGSELTNKMQDIGFVPSEDSNAAKMFFNELWPELEGGFFIYMSKGSKVTFDGNFWVDDEGNNAEYDRQEAAKYIYELSEDEEYEWFVNKVKSLM